MTIVWERVVHPVYSVCLSWAFVNFGCVLFVLVLGLFTF